MSTTSSKRQRSPHQAVGRWIRAEKRLAIYLRDHFMCSYCGRDLRYARSHEIGLDHLVPRSAGGGNDAINLVTACSSCNSARGDRPWVDYATGGGVERIQTNRHLSLNMELAKALMQDSTGSTLIEDER